MGFHSRHAPLCEACGHGVEIHSGANKACDACECESYAFRVSLRGVCYLLCAMARHRGSARPSSDCFARFLNLVVFEGMQRTDASWTSQESLDVVASYLGRHPMDRRYARR